MLVKNSLLLFANIFSSLDVDENKLACLNRLLILAYLDRLKTSNKIYNGNRISVLFF